MELNSEPDRANANLAKLVDLVARMREHQKAYFRYRTPDDLREAKRLEKQVDAEIERFTGVSKTSPVTEHPKLF